MAGLASWDSYTSLLTSASVHTVLRELNAKLPSFVLLLSCDTSSVSSELCDSIITRPFGCTFGFLSVWGEFQTILWNHARHLYSYTLIIYASRCLWFYYIKIFCQASRSVICMLQLKESGGDCYFCQMLQETWFYNSTQQYVKFIQHNSALNGGHGGGVKLHAPCSNIPV